MGIRHQPSEAVTATGIFEGTLSSLKTQSQILQALLAIVRHALLGTPIQLHHFDSSLRAIVLRQLSLGNLEILSGRLVVGWQELQQEAFLHYTPWLKGLSWAASMVTALWELHFSIWTFRNDILHHSDIMDTFLDMDTADFHILEEWSIGPTGIHSKDQFLFQGTSADELLAKASKYRREWLLCVQAARYGAEPDPHPLHDLDDSSSSSLSTLPP